MLGSCSCGTQLHMLQTAPYRHSSNSDTIVLDEAGTISKAQHPPIHQTSQLEATID